MKAYYTIFLITDSGLNYEGVANSTVNVSEYLLSKGYAVYHTHVNAIVEGTMVRDLIINKHLVDESTLITIDLLKDLRFDGTKQAEALLKSRKEKKK